VFYIYLRTNSDLCHLQHKLIGFYNRDEKYLQLGKDWVFKYSSLRFACEGLIYIQCFFFEYIGCLFSFVITQIPLIYRHSSVLSTWIEGLYVTSPGTPYMSLIFHLILKFHKM